MRPRVARARRPLRDDPGRRRAPRRPPVSLSEVEIFFFFPVVFALYWLGPRRTGWQNAVLLLASWVFYATWNVRLLPLLWVSTAIDWWAARWLDAHPAPEGGDDQASAGAADLARKRRWVL